MCSHQIILDSCGLIPSFIKMLISTTAIAIVLGVLVAYIIFKAIRKESNKIASSIPGLEPSHPKRGNNDELAEAGSLHQFLSELHQDYGSIASFWMGELYVVSIASAELFKQHAKLFNRPVSLFKLFEPLITPHSIQYANYEDGKRRRTLYDPMYSHDSVLNDHMPVFIQIGKEMMEEFSKIPPDEHIPIEKHMFQFSLRSICETSLGKVYHDTTQVDALKKYYDICWRQMEEAVAGVVHDEEDDQAFTEAKDGLYAIIQTGIDERRDVHNVNGNLLIDIILKSKFPDEVVKADILSYVIGGSHTTGLMLTWCMYYLACEPDIQEKCYKELVHVLADETIDDRVINDLKYLRQVLDETMRCSTLAPIAARFQDTDSILGGHTIPAGTPVIHALGVLNGDEKLWPEPHIFDPDRFEEVPDTYSFVPFGFAGGRKCPGYRFSYMEGFVFLSEFIRKFKVKLAPGQDKTVGKVYGLVTRPIEELFVTIEKRQ